jgi:Ca-activated chloride channel family protein
VHARYANGGSGTVLVRGRVAGRPFEQSVNVTLPATGGTMREELGSIWARTRIGDLTTALELQPNPALIEEVTQLGLAHHLLTPYTAFVAIDEGYRVDGEAVQVTEPSQLPAGMEPQQAPPTARPRAPARRPVAMPMRISGSGTGTRMGAGGGGGTPYAAAPEYDALLEGAMAAPEPTPPPRAEPSLPTVGVPDQTARADDRAASSGGSSAPVERSAARGRRAIGGRSGGGGAARCYEMARRADGTIDEEALRRCLASLGGGGAEPDDADEARKSEGGEPGVEREREPAIVRREDEAER